MHVSEFVDKLEHAISLGIHVLLVDLFAPRKFDPAGMHGAVWERFSDEPASSVPDNEPLALASYVAGPQPEAFLERLAVGVPFVDMPLFLNADRYIDVPLESTYNQAFRGLPVIWRQVLE